MQEPHLVDFLTRFIQDGDVVSIGTSKQGEEFLKKLALNVEHRGIEVRFIPTSAHLAAIASSLKLPLVSINDHEVDVGIEFVSQVDESMNYVKRDTHSLIRDKMIAQSAGQLFIVAEAKDLVERLHGVIPFEISAFGYKRTLAGLEKLGKASLRMAKNAPLKTETGNYLAEARVDEIYSYEDLDFQAKDVAGVLESGLFLGYADKLVLHDQQVRLIEPGDVLKAFAAPK